MGTALGSSGEVTLPGAVSGKTVYKVFDASAFTDVTSDFESAISVNDQIQQTALTNLTAGDNLTVVLSGGALTNASTSPSN